MLLSRFQKLAVEEISNTITHGFGLILSVIGFVVLIIMAASRGGVLLVSSCVIYGTSLMVLYAASTAYHSTTSASLKRKLQVLDCCIYLLIAGSYTPFGLVILGQSLWLWPAGFDMGVRHFGYRLEVFAKAPIPCNIGDLFSGNGLAGHIRDTAAAGGSRLCADRSDHRRRSCLFVRSYLFRLESYSAQPRDFPRLCSGRQHMHYLAVVVYVVPAV